MHCKVQFGCRNAVGLPEDTPMISFKRILVPVDFSDACKKAVAYGMTIAAQTNAKLFLAHIVRDMSALNYTFPSETFEVEKQQYEAAKRQMQKLIPSECMGKFEVEMIVKTGSIDAELLGIAREQAVDLVVMGSHGRRHFSRWLIGSVTERLLRKLPVPILSVSHVAPEKHAIELGLVSVHKILYAADLSEDATIGMQYAIELARGTSAKLTVAHVVDNTNFVLLSNTAVGYLEVSRKWVDSVTKKLHELVAREKPPDVEIEAALLEGKPYEEILRFADGHGIDIIVLNLQSRDILDRAFLGSTAERIVRLAHMPVLSVPVAINDSHSDRTTASSFQSPSHREW
jgi:nucleotide-binding universal stress UspA family protein